MGLLIKHFEYLVHPCDEANNGGCNQICNKREEKHECSCEAGFELGEDKMTCTKGWLRYTLLIFLYTRTKRQIIYTITAVFTNTILQF